VNRLGHVKFNTNFLTVYRFSWREGGETYIYSCEKSAARFTGGRP